MDDEEEILDYADEDTELRQSSWHTLFWRCKAQTGVIKGAEAIFSRNTRALASAEQRILDLEERLAILEEPADQHEQQQQMSPRMGAQPAPEWVGSRLKQLASKPASEWVRNNRERLDSGWIRTAVLYWECDVDRHLFPTPQQFQDALCSDSMRWESCHGWVRRFDFRKRRPVM